MADQSKSLENEILTEYDSSTLLQELGAGPSPSVSPDGRKRERSGRAVAHANPIRLRANRKGTPMSATSGPTSSGSSASDVLNRSLASRLRARLSTVGSIEYTQTWKESVTPAGRRFWEHTASARTIYVNVSTGALLLSPVPNPRSEDSESSGARLSRGVNDTLTAVARLAGFPTTSVGDTTNTNENVEDWEKRNRKAKLENPNLGGLHMKLGIAAQLAGFPTARTPTGGPESAERKQELGRTESGGGDLQAVALLAAWATATAMDARGARNSTSGRSNPDSNHHAGETLGDQIRGVILDLFFVPTGKRVVLAPEFSLWLMGYPEAWVKAAPGAKDWLEAQAALASECSREAETPSSPSLPLNL